MVVGNAAVVDDDDTLALRPAGRPGTVTRNAGVEADDVIGFLCRLLGRARHRYGSSLATMRASASATVAAALPCTCTTIF